MPEPAPPPLQIRILDAADHLLARSGFARMTVDDLAREAGIGKGTVYLYFRSKEDVALGCIDRMVEGLLERLRTIAGGPEPHPRRLRTMLEQRVLWRFDYASVHSSSIDDLLASYRPALLERRARHFAEECRVLSTVIREGARSGAFAPARVAGAAELLVTATNALLPYSLSVAELGNRRAIEARASRVAALLVAGLAAPVRPDRRTHSPATHRRSRS